MAPRVIIIYIFAPRYSPFSLPARILVPGYFGYFLIEENPATMVVLLTAQYHLYKADNSPGRFFNI